MKTKELTWLEVLQLPLDVKVRLSFWPENMYLVRFKNSDGCICMYIAINGIENKEEEIPFFYSYQDQWEIPHNPEKYTLRDIEVGGRLGPAFADKFPYLPSNPKKRVYMRGIEALRKMFDDVRCKMALDDEFWRTTFEFIYIDCNGHIFAKNNSFGRQFISKKYIDQNKWYVVDEE